MSSSPTVRPPRPLCCLPWLCNYLTCFWSMPNTHNQVWLGGYLIHPWSTPTTLSHTSASCGYLTYPWRMLPTHALLPSCGFSPIPGVRTPRPARCGYVAISPIPGVRPPRPPLCLCQLWLRGYLAYPWSTHTTHSQVWLCGYLTHPWSTPTTPTSLPLPAVAISLIPGVRTPRPARCGYVAISPIPGVRPPRPPLCLCQLWLCGYLTYPWSTHTTPSQVWLSHPSLEYAHHAHLSASASCGYVAISLIPGSCPPRLPFCQLRLRGFSSIPGVRTPRPARCVYLTYP